MITVLKKVFQKRRAVKPVTKRERWWKVFCRALLSFADGYDRKDFNYRSYKSNTSIGFYTNKTNALIAIPIHLSVLVILERRMSPFL